MSTDPEIAPFLSDAISTTAVMSSLVGSEYAYSVYWGMWIPKDFGENPDEPLDPMTAAMQQLQMVSCEMQAKTLENILPHTKVYPRCEASLKEMGNTALDPKVAGLVAGIANISTTLEVADIVDEIFVQPIEDARVEIVIESHQTQIRMLREIINKQHEVTGALLEKIEQLEARVKELESQSADTVIESQVGSHHTATKINENGAETLFKELDEDSSSSGEQQPIDPATEELFKSSPNTITYEPEKGTIHFGGPELEFDSFFSCQFEETMEETRLLNIYHFNPEAQEGDTATRLFKLLTAGEDSMVLDPAFEQERAEGQYRLDAMIWLNEIKQLGIKTLDEDQRKCEAIWDPVQCMLEIASTNPGLFPPAPESLQSTQVPPLGTPPSTSPSSPFSAGQIAFLGSETLQSDGLNTRMLGKVVDASKATNLPVFNYPGDEPIWLLPENPLGNFNLKSLCDFEPIDIKTCTNPSLGTLSTRFVQHSNQCSADELYEDSRWMIEFWCVGDALWQRRRAIGPESCVEGERYTWTYGPTRYSRLCKATGGG